ncbi:MAG: hypothetical protein M0042_16155 [Nitrospiraceae bacterium]|nr:hypothetical protein [Nitrospiraceae bacterium]
METFNKILAHKRFNLIAFGVIAVLVLIAYSNTFTASFHFDDNPSIIENPSIRHVTGENILRILASNRPVVFLSIMLNYQLSGLNVIGWHIFNIGVHIANSIFVYLLILWTLMMPAAGSMPETKARRMALFAALLFGVHPIQTESVTYIISRTELLATFFYLLTFILFVKGGARGKYAYAVGMLISSLCAMASKEWAVTLPALLVLYDFLFVAESKFKPLLSRWYLYLLVALPWVYILNTLNLFSEGGNAGVGFNLQSATGVTMSTYFYTSLNVMWTYIRLLFLPINQNLDYDYPVAKTLFEMPTILSLIAHIAVVAAVVWLYAKKKWTIPAFGMAWFYIGLSPTQSVVPVVDVIFEHRMYMPAIGVFLAFIFFYEKVFDWLGSRKKTEAVTV